MGKYRETLEAWIDGNMFAFKKGDGAAYLALYILIPVAITGISLWAFPKNDVQAVYCYVTILVSAFNCIYDAANRWCSGVRAFKNSKLLLVMGSSLVVAAYCIVVIFSILITGTTSWRHDGWLLSYVVAVVIAFGDVVACFMMETAWKACVALTDIEEVM